ncbi:MAG TPA: hypothetical protein PK760_13565, partial [Flavobacteriales bacterium]|nr:hypothetical protein [Flavobacteriales bacterium]
GNLGSTSGVGDPVITTSYAFIKKKHSRLDALVGMKLNANDAGTSNVEGRSLPMPYQTSLGTKDLLIGINYRHGRWNTALAYQHVLVNENKNGYDPIHWMDDAKGQMYFGSWDLDRRDDAVARIQYSFTHGRLTVQPGALAIYHLGMDRRAILTQPGDFVWSQPHREIIDIAGSNGLTLNITGDVRYKLNDAWAIEGSFGTPVVVRDVRPDGLTRSLVVNAGLRFAF